MTVTQADDPEQKLDSLLHSGLLLYVIFPLHVLTIFSGLGLMAYFIYRVMKIDEMEEKMKVRWCIALVVANIFAMPVYWYLHIWKDDGTRTDDSAQIAQEF